MQINAIKTSKQVVKEELTSSVSFAATRSHQNSKWLS